MLRILLAIALLTASTLAADAPKRIEPDVANQHLVKKVDAVTPPIAALAGVGGTVTVDAVISTDGKVSSVVVLSGPALLQRACTDAIKQREYKPFLENGKPIEVVTKIECGTAAPRRTPSEEQAARDFYPASKACTDLLHARSYAEAEKTCAEALTLADQLPQERIIERSEARTFLAHALVGDGRPADAIPLYEKALEIYRAVEPSQQDADFATDHVNLARAYFLAGQLDKADPLYARGIQIFEAAIKALPDMKDNYTARMKRAILEYAKLKEAEGDADAAAALTQRAATIP